MNTNKTNNFEYFKINFKVKLSLLWTVVSFFYEGNILC